MSKKILLIHGPNLNYLGKRNSSYYGNLTLNQLEKYTEQKAAELGFSVSSFQSNHEGDLIDFLQKESENCSGIIINPGALTHYSYALYDALVDTNLPIIEVHLSDIEQREPWRKISVTAPAALKIIKGKKEQGYQEAIRILSEHINGIQQ